jgi:acylphosphatase
MTEIKRAVHLHIRGHVQGVYFRGWTAEHARARRITGWIRNRCDGSVEARFHGAAADVEALVALCREGPPGARVTSVEVVAADGTDASEGFSVLPTV